MQVITMPDGQRGRIIQVKVKLFGHLKQVAQQSVLDIETRAGTSVYDVIQAVAQRLGNDFRKALLEQSGNLHGGIEIMLNSEHLPARRIRTIYISEDCELFIMPMIEGGLQSFEP